MIQSKIYRSCHITLTNVCNLLLSHFSLCTDVIKNVINDLKCQAKMLSYSKALHLKLRVLRLTKNWHCSHCIRHKCSSFIISFVHVVGNDTFQCVIVSRNFIFRQGLNNFSCRKVVHGNGIDLE